MATLTVEIPQALADALARHQAKTGATTDRVVAAAIALRLLQSGGDGRALIAAYLDAEFPGRRSGADAA